MAFTCLIEFEPRGQQRLQRAVMKVLGDFAAVTPVGLHCLRKQLTGHLLQRLHPRGPTGEHVTQRGHRDGQPEQKAEMRVHHVRQADLVVPFGIEDPHREIAQRRNGSDDRRQRRPVLKRHGDRQREEDPQQCRGRATRHRHSLMITNRSTAVDAQSPHRGTGPFSTAISHTSAATAYTPRITAYNPGSQWSTSQIQTSTAIRPINGSRRIAETRTGSAAK